MRIGTRPALLADMITIDLSNVRGGVWGHAPVSCALTQLGSVFLGLHGGRFVAGRASPGWQLAAEAVGVGTAVVATDLLSDPCQDAPKKR
jgi:hypothetical protein